MAGEQKNADGWDWFSPPIAHDTESDRVRQLFEATFAGANGARILAHLRAVFLERRLPPQASDAELRHLEGARAAIAYIERLAMPQRTSGRPDQAHAGDDR